jgi:hypothetical protein
MKLVNNNCLQIAIEESVSLSDFVSDPSLLTGVQIKLVYNETEYVNDYTVPFPLCDDDEGFVQCGSDFFINPKFFTESKFPDGVYTVTLTGVYTTGIQVTETACTYVDCETKCKVLESQCLEAMMYHYTLHQSYTCNCNCDKLFTIWEALQHILSKDNICDKC